MRVASMGSNEGFVSGDGGFPVTRPKAFLRPPENLLARVRWIFLLFTLVNAVPVVVILNFLSPEGLPLRLAAGAALAWLVLRYVRGYARGRFSLLLDTPEGLAIFLVAFAAGETQSILGLVYVGLYFRSLYGSLRFVILRALLYFGAFVAAVALASGTSGILSPETLPHGFGLVAVSYVAHLLASTLARHERALAREKALRDAGAALVAAPEKEKIQEAALDAALSLVGVAPNARVGLALGPAEEMVVTASAGYRAAEVRGIRLDAHALPDPLRVRFFAKRSIGAENGDAVVLRTSLGLTPTARPFFITPLFAGEELKGAIVVASEAALSQDLKEGLETLGFQVALALESASLSEKLFERRSEERFRTLVQNSSDCITLLDADGTIRYVSSAIERMLGYKPEDRIGNNPFDLIHPDDVARAQSLFAESLQSPSINLSLEARMRHRDRSWRYVEVMGRNLLDDPSVGAIVLNSRDVTERKTAQEELARLATFPELDPNPIVEMDLAGNLTYVNPAADRLFPDLRELECGHPILAGFEASAVKLRAGEEGPLVDEVGVGEAFYHRATSYVSENNLVRVYAIDITERKLLEDQLAHRAFHDPLTGLPNRALFVNRVDHALERAGRHEDHAAVLFVDLDRFKTVNDSLGHEAGDRLLVGVARRLEESVRPGDTVARLAGDEFAVLLEDIPGTGEALQVAGRISAGLRRPFALDAQETFVTASIGISLGAPGRAGPEDLLREADIAMYSAKRGGKDRHAVYEEAMGTKALERLALENDLRRAIECGEFEVYYQPKLDLETGGIMGVEALVRWNHPERGLVSPGEFIPLAEETALILPLGK